MNVNVSALNRAFEFIHSKYQVGDDADITLDLFGKENKDFLLELKLQITLSSAWNYKEEKVFMLTLERRYDGNEKEHAVQLYHYLTKPVSDWRKIQPARVILIDDVSKYANYSIVKISCSSLSIEWIKNLVMEVLKFIYADDNLRKLYVNLTDLDRKIKKRFSPSKEYHLLKDGIASPRFSLN